MTAQNEKVAEKRVGDEVIATSFTGVATPPTPYGRLDFIDGMRALAALFVVVCHSFYEPTNGFYKSRLLNHLGLSYGKVAVDVFIVISGFCLMLPIARRSEEFGSLWEFFRRRARRILPPYYAAILLSTLFILTIAHTKTGTAWDVTLPLTRATFVKHLLLVHDLPLPGRGGNINYPLWSVAVEFHLYLLMPVIALSLRRWGSRTTLLWTIAAGLALHIGLHGRFDIARPWYLGLFALGAVAAREGIRRPMSQTYTLRLGTYALLILAATAILWKGNFVYYRYHAYFDTLLGAITALFLYITLFDVSKQHSWFTRFCSWSPLVFIGGFSYSLYLIHAPLLHLFDRMLTPYVPAGPRMFAMLLLSIPLIVGIAYGFHLAFEKPFMSARSRLKPAPIQEARKDLLHNRAD